MGYLDRKRPTGRPAQQMTVLKHTVPPSTGGINALNSIMNMAPEDCIYCHNLMPSEYGLRLRKGYREWAINVSGDSINTIIPFEGQLADASQDQMWAVTPLGIYNISLFNTVDPVQDVAFSVNTAEAGFGVWTEFTNDATDRFLQYADSRNGLHEYSEETGLWDIPSLTGPDVEKIAFVTTWKNRLWYIEEASGDAWYLSPDSNSGNCTKFTFGSKFKHGGELMGIWNWTVDGGDGVDDLLVAVSRGGDVLVYKGQDPDLAPTDPNSFSLVGSYFIGELPESRNVGVEYGGELYILSVYGITSIRDLLQGVLPTDAAKSPSGKISRFLRQDVQDGKDALNWAMHINPSDGFLQIVTPYRQAKDAIQYNQNLLTRAWGMWEGVPAQCAEVWSGSYYIGDREGTVYIYDGELDNTTIDSAQLWVDDPQGAPPEWSQPAAEEYACDGTQVAETAFPVEIGEDSKLGVVYDVTYTITGYVSGRHAVNFGSAESTSEFQTGGGAFNGRLTAMAVSSIAAVVGDADFEGTFTLVSLKEASVLGNAIPFDILTSFQAPGGEHSLFKRVGFIRTIGVIAGTASVNVQAVYDYQIETNILPPPQLPSQGGNVWDVAIWDTDLWDFTQEGKSFPTGALGLGRVVAVGMSGSSNTRINIVGWDLTYTQGGFL